MTESKPRLQPRVSLLSLLLLVSTVAAIAFALVAERKVRALKIDRDAVDQEIQTLKYLAGDLRIDHPTQFVVQQLPDYPRLSADTQRWEWVLHVPVGDSATVVMAQGAVPTASRPEADAAQVLAPGEHAVVLEVFRGRRHHRDSAPPKWRLVVTVDGRQLFESDEPAPLLAAVRRGGGQYSSMRDFRGQSVTATELIRYESGDKALQTERGAAGFVLWLET